MVKSLRVVCAHDCPDMCSLIAHVEDGKVVRVQGDPDHPYTAGFACGKVNRDTELVHSPERLSTLDSASRFRQTGEWLAAGNCFVTAYEEVGASDPWLAYQAARSYHEAGRIELARAYYQRVIATTNDDALSADARRGLAELDAH